MAKIFISYSRASKDVVEQLVQDLTDDDQESWFDQHLTGGQSWWDNILSEIRECEIFVAALTPDSLESRACQREIKYAKDLQKILLPVRLSDQVSPDFLPPDLSVLQWVDYSSPDKQAFKSLQRTLRNLPKSPPLPDPLPDAPAVPISYLNKLRMKIDTDSQLQLQDQKQLVFDLRAQFQNGGPAKEIIELLQRLKKRDDLFSIVSQDIDYLQREIDSGRSSEGSSKSGEPNRPRLPPEIPFRSFIDRFFKLIAGVLLALNPPVTPRAPEVMPGKGGRGELEKPKNIWTSGLLRTNAILGVCSFLFAIFIYVEVYLDFRSYVPDTGTWHYVYEGVDTRRNVLYPVVLGCVLTILSIYCFIKISTKNKYNKVYMYITIISFCGCVFVLFAFLGLRTPSP